MPLLLLTVFLACSRAPEPVGRVLLVGIDGAAPELMRSLGERGRIPNLRGIADAGLFVPLRSSPPYLSPRLWNTIATGKVPAKHGIHAFTRFEGDRQVLLLSSDRKVHALWNIASDAGLRVAVINWWNTFPPERINGVMVSDHALSGRRDRLRSLTGATDETSGPTVHPEAWSTRLAELVDDDTSPVEFADPFSIAEGFPDYVETSRLSEFFREDAAIARIALAAEEEYRPDLLMVLFPGIDRVSHWLWGSLEPAELYAERLRPTAAQLKRSSAALEAYYEYTDALIGALMRSFSDEDLVLVVSDHGFERASAESVLSGVHWSNEARDGVLFARGRGITRRASEVRVTIVDVTPTVLSWLRLPRALDMDGAAAPFLVAEAREPVATYDTKTIHRIGSSRSAAEETILENLRALGYIE
ncbi:MAG: alkaline phosphatase family protein [Deltaproteobacteria bacterium]|nr:MAG: alkaline phosphatase family protein [Deltaproteobacteria bacterium]